MVISIEYEIGRSRLFLVMTFEGTIDVLGEGKRTDQ
jgi:hypothetical protein